MWTQPAAAVGQTLNLVITQQDMTASQILQGYRLLAKQVGELIYLPAKRGNIKLSWRTRSRLSVQKEIIRRMRVIKPLGLAGGAAMAPVPFDYHPQSHHATTATTVKRFTCCR